MFEYGELEDDYYGYKYKDILPNGQTIEFNFVSYYENTLYSVEMEIYSKRKRKSISYLDSTGKCGMSGLILAKSVLVCFIEYIKEITPKDITIQILVQGSDNRRTRIYKRYLTKLGFSYTRTKFQDMGMCINVKGNNN